MGLIAQTAQSNRIFAIAPAGISPGVCCDAIDLGMVFSEKFQKSSRMVKLAFQLNERITRESIEEAAALKGLTPTEEDFKQVGKRFLVFSPRFPLSLHENSNLSKYLTSWRNKPFTPEDRRNGFDLDLLIGVNGLITISHNPAKNDPTNIFANATSVTPLTQRELRLFGLSELLEVEDYVRVQDRPQN